MAPTSAKPNDNMQGWQGIHDSADGQHHGTRHLPIARAEDPSALAIEILVGFAHALKGVGEKSSNTTASAIFRGSTETELPR